LPHVVDGDAQVHGFVDQHRGQRLPDGICNKPFQTLRGVGEVAVFIEVKITGVSES
jgi:hypothetical protein